MHLSPNTDVLKPSQDKSKLQTTIIAIENKSEPGALMKILSNSKKAAAEMGCSTLEIVGADVEPRLASVMKSRYGFSNGEAIEIPNMHRPMPTLRKTFSLDSNLKPSQKSKP